MFFKTAYEAAKLGYNPDRLNESDTITRKVWQDKTKFPFTSVYFPTDAFGTIGTEQDREQNDWVVIPAKDTPREHARIHRNIKKVLGIDVRQGDRANELLAEIKKWHAETFKTATLEGQMNKLVEEEMEYQGNHKLSEIADILIVAAGLEVRNSVVGYAIMKYFRDCCYNHRPFFGQNSVKVIDALEAKFEVNKERTRKGMWKDMNDGRFHH